MPYGITKIWNAKLSKFLECHFKADLHFGNYRSKLVYFEAQKNIFYVKKALG